MKQIVVSTLFVAVVLHTAVGQAPARDTIPFNTGWEFSFVNSVFKNPSSQLVNLPHTWNAGEVKNTATNYQRAAAVYVNSFFAKNEWQDKRVFLYFEGANMVADVFLNKKYIANHEGGYSAFCIEITDSLQLGRSNMVNVMVSNTYRLDVLPMSGDFNKYGGLHRPVSILVTAKDCISPLDYASSGVYITPTNISSKQCLVKIKTLLSLKANDAAKAVVTIRDANHKQVATRDVSFIANAGFINSEFTISEPHLWNGKADPYLYSATVSLISASGNIIDEVKENFGVRSYFANPQKGFYLNDKPYKLSGVAFHEDREGVGSAYERKQYEEDVNLLKEIGASAVRLAHYPHGKPMYDMADSAGFVMWTEIPLIGFGGKVGEGYVHSPAMEENAKQMLRELIRQHYNHPSVFFWGLFNELTTNYDHPLAFIKELQTIAKEEDSERLTVVADFLNESPYENVSDIISWNKYFGWYDGQPRDIGKWLDNRHAALPNRAIGISEYGAGASVNQFTDSVYKVPTTGKFHPMQWQTQVHEQNWEEMQKRPWLWSTFVWVFADFGSEIRTEGDAMGINDKGLVTYDKQTKKDAFYFYKANWNPQPMLHLCEQNYKQRTKNIIDIKAYSTLPEVQLWVNAKIISAQNPDYLKRTIWKNVALQPGKNKIQITAVDGKVLYREEVEWIVE